MNPPDFARRLAGRILPGNQLVQFGIPRSGSTLVFNILRELFPLRHIKKTHFLSGRQRRLPIVATFRNPLDVVASVFQCQSLAVTQEELRRQVLLLYRNGLVDILEVKGSANALLLRYEEFSQDFEFLFDELDRFFRMQTTASTRRALADKYSIESVKGLIAKDWDFSRYDKKTLLHGNHISRFEGRSHYYDEVFSAEQVDFLQRYLQFFIDEMGYADA